MKRLFVFVLCLMMVVSLFSCRQSQPIQPSGISETATSSVSTPQNTEQPSQSTPQTPSNNDPTPPQPEPLERTPSLDAGVAYELYPFLSEEVKSTWREDLITVLSSVDIWIPGEAPGSYAVGLMDLNFDGVPEVLVAHPGGSMGNVFVDIYDLETNSRIVCYDGKGLDDFEDVICLCVAEVNGSYVTLAQGNIRLGDKLEWSWLIEQLPSQIDTQTNRLKTDLLFAVSNDFRFPEDGPYLVMGEMVTKSEYATACEKFHDDYRIIKSTQIQMIRWSTLNATSKEQLVTDMVDALLGSSQRFIDIQAEDASELAWRRAYLEVIEAEKDSTYRYALVHIDDDDIPELYLYGFSEATGDRVYSYQNGSLFMQHLHRCGGGKYIEQSGMLANVNGHMGRRHTEVYRLDENGFTQTFYALSVEVVETVPEGKGDGFYEFSYEYYVEDEQVAEEEYLTAVEASFDFERSVKFSEVLVSYDVIKEQIIGDQSDFEGK